jgi:hypothetical protein
MASAQFLSDEQLARLTAIRDAVRELGLKGEDVITDAPDLLLVANYVITGTDVMPEVK